MRHISEPLAELVDEILKSTSPPAFRAQFLTIAEASRRTGVGESVTHASIDRGDLAVFQPCPGRGDIRYLAEDDLPDWMVGDSEVARPASGGTP